jgi:protein gp37
VPGATSIEWADATWNPTTGCSKVSAGCAHCYAETFAERWRGIPGHPYEQGFDLRLWPQRLDVPLRWRKPRRIFVNSMSDLFHPDVPAAFIDQVLDTMWRAEQHVFMVLTKRPEIAADYCSRYPGVAGHLCELPPNLWLGTSIENRRVVGRADELRRVPAAVRFISAEPLLGPLLGPWPDRYAGPDLDLTGIDWLIVGGESGGHSRLLRIEWVDALAQAAQDAGVALFVKQLGARWSRAQRASDAKGGDPADWPAHLRVRDTPRARRLARTAG